MPRTFSLLLLTSLLAGLLLALLMPPAGARLGGAHHGLDAPRLEASPLAQPAASGDREHVHAHEHDGATDDEARGEHTHGHAAIEQVHDKPMPLGHADLRSRDDSMAWCTHAGWSATSAHPWRLERPPKHSLA